MGQTINPKTTTKFTKEMPQKFLDLCDEGGSVPEFCRQEKICRATFERWCEIYPTMADARKKGKLIAEGWWIEKAREHLITYGSKFETTTFNTNLYKFIMGGRFGHTADKSLLDALKAIEAKQDKILAMAPTTAIAEEAEYEETTD